MNYIYVVKSESKQNLVFFKCDGDSLQKLMAYFDVDFRPQYRNTSDMAVSFVDVIRVGESTEIYGR